MKVTAGKLFEATEVLRRALRDRRDDRVHLPTLAAFRIALLIRQLEPEYLVLQESRIELLKRLGKEVEKQPGFWAVLPENNEEFQKQWSLITEEELEVHCKPILLATLGDGMSYFSVQELLLLGDFVKE